jgi:predicted deacylase
MEAERPTVTVLRGATGGPTVGLLGGVHGDEYEGVLAARALAAGLAHDLVCGEVRIAAPAHPAAWAAGTRRSPLDGADLARRFPGRPGGDPTDQVAHAITDEVVRGSDLLIDLHSGGSGFAMPFLCGYQHDGALSSTSRRHADTFGARFTWRHDGPPAPGRSLSAAFDLGIPAIYVEGSGGRSVDASELRGYVDGVRRVLHSLGMLDAAPPPGPPSIAVRGDGNTDAGITAPAAGYLVARRSAGDTVAAGEVVAHIVTIDSVVVAEVVAPADGAIMLLRRDALVAASETVCIVAPMETGP